MHRSSPQPSDAPKFLEHYHRFQIINFWRNSAVDWPLTFCDHRGLDLKNDTFLVALERAGENIGS